MLWLRDDLVPHDHLVERLRAGGAHSGDGHISISATAECGIRCASCNAQRGECAVYCGSAVHTLASVSYSAVTYTKSCLTFQLKIDRRSASI